jgi:hypothetical protein
VSGVLRSCRCTIVKVLLSLGTLSPIGFCTSGQGSDARWAGCMQVGSLESRINFIACRRCRNRRSKILSL